MAQSHLRAIGIDIGVTNLKTVCVGANDEILSEDVVSTFATDQGWPARVKERIAELEAAHHARAETVGIAAPGIADPSARSIWWMQGRLDQVQGLDWTQELARPQRVPVLNDAQAALLGEVWRGAAQGKHDVVMLTLGTGVGGAAMVDGNLLKGHLGRAGHLGHICVDVDGKPDIVGTPGSLEEAVGDCTMAQRSGGKFQHTLLLVARHIEGDERATQLWLRTVHALACGIISLVNVLDPEVVILGGGIALAGPALFDPLEKELDKMEWRPHGRRVSILPAQLGEYAGAYGAAWNAMTRSNRDRRP